MNINDDYQKRRGQITSFSTGEIIEPSREYLEINYILYIFKFLVFKGNTCEDAGK